MRHKFRLTIIALIILLFVGGALGFGRRGREWIDVNILAVGTKAKQAKYLELAGKHLREPDLHARYLRRAEEMAEAILYLDGAEIAVAERFERATYDEERELLKTRPVPEESLAASRIENEKMFDFLVKNYQFNSADIKKHQEMVQKHIDLVEDLMPLYPSPKAAHFLIEARKFQAAGLNMEAYDQVKKAKNILYSQMK